MKALKDILQSDAFDLGRQAASFAEARRMKRQQDLMHKSTRWQFPDEQRQSLSRHRRKES